MVERTVVNGKSCSIARFNIGAGGEFIPRADGAFARVQFDNGDAMILGMHDAVRKYDPNQPRDDQGQWTDGGFSDDEKEALKVYGGEQYHDINHSLRHGMTPPTGLGVHIKNLDALMARSATPKEMKVWRIFVPEQFKSLGIERLKVGETFTDRGFVSTTTTPNKIADELKDPIKVQIVIPKGYPAVQLGSHATIQQKEITLDRNTTFRVKEAQKYYTDSKGKKQKSDDPILLEVVPKDKVKSTKKRLSLISKEFDEALHPRDDSGKFTDGGGNDYEVRAFDSEKHPFAVWAPGNKEHMQSFKTREEADKFAADLNESKRAADEQDRKRESEDAKLGNISYHPNPEVTNVGGDQWNRDTALRLERQYIEAKPALSIIEKNAVYNKVVTDNFDEDHKNPTTWNELSSDQQSDAETAWRNAHYDSYYENEKEYYYSDTAKEDAARDVAYKFNEGAESDWAKDALDKMQEDRDEQGKPEIPYTNDQIIDAITLDEESAELDKFDDSKLKSPEGYIGIEQGQNTLPGIEPEDPSKRLTQEMRDDIKQALNGAVEGRIDDVAGDLPVPEYIGESVNESLGTTWDEMSDEGKFEAASEYLSGVKESADANTTTTTLDQLPANYDPLNQPYGEHVGEQTNKEHKSDYERTQALAKIMSQMRSLQLLEQRGLGRIVDVDANGKPILDKSPIRASDVDLADNRLWKGWVGSSTSLEGKLLQLASSEELGGRLYQNTVFPEGSATRDTLMDYANREFGVIGGYDGIMAMTRAKWETSQYMLDKAGISTVDVYRGIRPQVAPGSSEMVKVSSKLDSWWSLPSYSLSRNGALSTSLMPKVSNDWNGDDRIVFRISAPRTAVLSIPAYGKNYHEEREVVLAGTAWKNWDAWYRTAPEFNKYPMVSGEKALV